MVRTQHRQPSTAAQNCEVNMRSDDEKEDVFNWGCLTAMLFNFLFWAIVFGGWWFLVRESLW